MTNDDLNRLSLMLARGIYRTQFETVKVPYSDLRGVEIGSGKCIAVILHLNAYQFNGTALGNNTVTGFCIYYGDRNKQQRELLAGESSPIIFAADLSEIYVRAATAWQGDTEGGDDLFEVQLEIYHGKDNDD